MHGIDAKILVLGVIPTKDICKAIQHRVALTVPSKAWLKEAIRNIPEKNEKELWLHAKIDSGMGRLGMKDVEEYKDVVDIINKKMILFLKACLHISLAQMNQGIL